MIPTHSKERLPQGFIYPLGAQVINELIGDVPQFGKIELCFNWKDDFRASRWRQRIQERGLVRLAAINYLSIWDEWRIYFYSVPSDCSVAARDFLLAGALAQVGDTLRGLANSPRHFHHDVTWQLPPVANKQSTS
ncbi:hypothetical protein RAL92_11670 [Metapseudomonas otitidis]|uniref:hypothetical protein n=1 Tax=Metapseudomonas otitidis TaxID=319939 RepID=UPI003217BE7A